MRLDQRGAVPGDQPALDQPRRQREGLGPVVGGEDVGLVRQQHDLRTGRVDLGRLDLRVAAVGVGERVGQSGAREQVAGERVAADDHPRVAPDRGGRARPVGGGVAAPQLARPEQPVGVRPAERLGEQPLHRRDPLRHRLDVGHPHRHARLAQPAYVELAVLLLVGDDQVGGEVDDRCDGGVLGAADAGYVEVRGVGAPLGGADQHAAVDRGQRLGQRGDQAHHAAGRSGQVDGGTQIVVQHLPEPTLRPGPAS